VSFVDGTIGATLLAGAATRSLSTVDGVLSTVEDVVAALTSLTSRFL
jgi:hypothetical protein